MLCEMGRVFRRYRMILVKLVLVGSLGNPNELAENQLIIGQK